jgi:hypothetical protein
VIHLFGRKPRHKPIDAVIEEVAALQRFGVKNIFFCDDNFIGDPRYAKELLAKLIPLNNSFERPLGFLTQVTVNLAHDKEMMELMAEANFVLLFVGIETPRKASLVEVHKIQNTRGDLVQDILRIQSYGLMVRALIIVGFDNDDITIFDELYNFMQDACIVDIRMAMLHAYPGTPQTARLLKQGRVLDFDRYEVEDTLGATNILPAQMTREELFEGYVEVQERLLDWNAFEQRLMGLIRNFQYKPAHVSKTRLLSSPRLARFQAMGRRWPKLPGVMFRLALKADALKARARKMFGKPPAEETPLFKLNRIAGGLDPNARKILMQAIPETLVRAPWQLRAVVRTLILQPENGVGLKQMRDRLRARLAIEKSPGYQHKLLATVQIPPEFKRLYREPFGMTVTWLREGLEDQRLVAEGLIRIWKDFLIRYGSTFEKFEDYHTMSLKELAERTIEQGNSGQFSHTRSMAQVEALTSAQLRSLSEQIMFSVEQDLKSDTHGDLTNVTLGPKPVAAKA